MEVMPQPRLRLQWRCASACRPRPRAPGQGRCTGDIREIYGRYTGDAHLDHARLVEGRDRVRGGVRGGVRGRGRGSVRGGVRGRIRRVGRVSARVSARVRGRVSARVRGRVSARVRARRLGVPTMLRPLDGRPAVG